MAFRGQASRYVREKLAGGGVVWREKLIEKKEVHGCCLGK
jgi:hypothetical protein